jgi:hypothetical protein
MTAAREPNTMIEVEGAGNLAAWEGGAKATATTPRWKALDGSTNSRRPVITTARAVWRRIIDAVGQLANTTPPGPVH